MSRSHKLALKRILGILAIIFICIVAIGGGMNLTYEIRIPGWIVGTIVGTVIFVSVFFSVGLFLNAAVDAIDSPIYRQLAVNAFFELGHYPILPSLAIAMLISYTWRWEWGLPIGAAVYVVSMCGIYVWAHAGVYSSIGSATFVADTYRAAGVPLAKS